MRRFAAAAVGALLAGAAQAAAPSGPIEVEAGTVSYDVARDRYLVTDGAVLRRGAVVLRARTANYDASTGEVDAAGDALLLEPGRALAGTSIHAVLDGPFEAHEVVAFTKDAPIDLSRATSLDEARRAGRNRLTFGGALVYGKGGDEFSVDRARITLCDCGGGAPSWEIRAHRAHVVPGRRATLTWPVFYVTPRFLFIDHPVPALVLPWIYVPLGQREAGLLLPEINYGGRTGFALSEPLFVPLGESYDATVTFDYAFGISRADLLAGSRGVEGAGGSLELRWAPAPGAGGRFRIFELHDVARNYAGGVASPPHGDRVALALSHEQRFDRGDVLHLEVGLVNDALYVQDFTRDVLLRGIEYRRSTAAFTAPGDDLLLEAHADYLLPLSFSQQTASGLGYGLFGSAVPAFHRIPSATATLLPVRLAGPVRLSAVAGITRFAPIHGATGDEGASGIGAGDRGWPGLGTNNPGQLDGRWEPGERLAANRAHLRAELRAPLSIGRALAIEPWAGATAAGYTFDAARGPLANGWGVAGLALSTQLSRPVGTGHHVIEPRVEWRAGTGELGPALPAYAYDELDFAPPPAGAAPGPLGLPLRPLSAAPPGGFNQLRLSLRNRVTAPAGALSADRARVDLGQDLDLAGTRLAETWAQAGAGVGPLSVNFLARFYAFGAQPPAGTPQPQFPSWLDRFTELSASAALSDSRGDSVGASLLAIGSGGSGQLKAGLEPFFDPRPLSPSLAPLPVGVGHLGASARVAGGLTVGYGADFTVRTTVGKCGSTEPSGPYVVQHAGTFVWDSPCGCWKAGLVVNVNPCDPHPSFQAMFDLSQLSAGRFQ